jgi:hypothetical protein
VQPATALLALAIVARALLHDGATPVVTGDLLPRTPRPPLVVRIEGEPALAPGTPVRWSAPDGKNLFTLPGAIPYTGSGVATLTTTAGAVVGVWRRGDARGTATLVADVGGATPGRLTLAVRDADGLSFGCYGFTTMQQSVRFVHGIAESSSLGDADVAITGPGRFEETLPGYGCWGDNFLAGDGAYRLVFAIGGRVLAKDAAPPFAAELPYGAIDAAHPLEIESADGETIRLHLTPAAGTYFFGWYEALGGTATR